MTRTITIAHAGAEYHGEIMKIDSPAGGLSTTRTHNRDKCVKVSQSSPIFDGVKRDTTDLDAEEAITRAERAMAEGDRVAALAAVLEARDLLIEAAVLEKVMAYEAGDQL